MPEQSAERWVSLFSGGKDSSYSLWQAQQSGRSVTDVLTVTPPADSYMYQPPPDPLPALAAESIGVSLHRVTATDVTIPEGATSGTIGDAEVAPLADALADLQADGTVGVVAGAVESSFQRDRIATVCDQLGLDLYAPLWQCDPESTLRAMVDAGFRIHIVAVAAAGLDQSWLGRIIDHETIDQLVTCHETHGIHVMGEGGEFETVVTDGPHMAYPIEFTARTHWDGTRGHLEITDAAGR